jgi:hypothetical protein
MNKTNFCACLEVLRKYSAWESAMYNNGLDFSNTPINDLTEKLQLAMCGFDLEWSYDKKLEFDWVIEWSFNPDFYKGQERHGRKWTFEDAGSLYDFLVFMNEYGWED